jgi:hypothetical protein
MKRLIAALIFFLSSVNFAYAKDCWYQGKRYSDGAKNDKGQVCDGQTGGWK